LKNSAVSSGRSALLRRLLPAALLLGTLAPTGQAQVVISGRAGEAGAARVAPRGSSNSEPDDVPLPQFYLRKETPLFPDWNALPDTTRPDESIGPPGNLPSLTTGKTDSPGETPGATPQPGPLRLGTVSFNQMAESVNAWKVGAPKADDLSRQFQPGASTPSFLSTIPAGGLAAIGLGAFAIILGLTLAQYENDREERRRQKRRRHHRHRHRTSE